MTRIASGTGVLTLTLLLLPACAPKIGGPSMVAPTPGYTRVDALTQEAWDAAVDFLIDNGIGFEYISNDLKLANIKTVLSEGGTIRSGVMIPDTMARRFADCGTINGKPFAGAGVIVADVAVRVRPDDAGRPLVKVVIPRVRQTVATTQYACVSTGLFEEQAREGIQKRLKPIMHVPGG
jgi:hypothetical protein